MAGIHHVLNISSPQVSKCHHSTVKNFKTEKKKIKYYKFISTLKIDQVKPCFVCHISH